MAKKELTFVTGNRHKFDEVQAILKKYGISLVQENLETDEPETSSLEEIALHKAKEAYAKLRKQLIVEDTGVYFSACDNFPGAKSRRVFEEIGYDGLFKALEGKSRNAYFRALICFIGAPERFKLFEGRWHGTITDRVILPEKDRMPYEKIFLPDGMAKAVVEMPDGEKNKLSHRAIASNKLGRHLKENFM